jgi:hypothetical protein
MITVILRGAKSATTSHSSAQSFYPSHSIIMLNPPLLIHTYDAYFPSADRTFRYASKSNRLSLGSVITIQEQSVLSHENSNNKNCSSRSYPSQEMPQSQYAAKRDNVKGQAYFLHFPSLRSLAISTLSIPPSPSQSILACACILYRSQLALMLLKALLGGTIRRRYQHRVLSTGGPASLNGLA